MVDLDFGEAEGNRVGNDSYSRRNTKIALIQGGWWNLGLYLFLLLLNGSRWSIFSLRTPVFTLPAMHGEAWISRSPLLQIPQGSWCSF